MVERRILVVVAAVATLAVVFAGGWVAQGSGALGSPGPDSAGGDLSSPTGDRLERVEFASAHSEDVLIEVTVRRDGEVLERRTVRVWAAEEVDRSTYAETGVALPLGVEGPGEYVLVLELPAGSERVRIFDEVDGDCATVLVTVEGPENARVQALAC